MTSCQAIVVGGDGKTAHITDVVVPEPAEGWLLVRVKAVAINPTDWKHVAKGWAPVGSRVGCDYAGVVEKIGLGDTAGFSVGDPVAGFTHGCNFTRPELGAFGAFLLAKAAVQIKIPPNLSFEQAATLGVSIVTVGQGLYKALQLPLPTNPSPSPIPVLIHGGSTATGMWAIQFAKASNLTVIATASPHNFDLVRGLGADAVFDYASPTCGDDIRAHTAGKLLHAWDCVGGSASGAICARALSADVPGRLATISNLEASEVRDANPLVDGPHWTLGYDCFAEPFYVAFHGKERHPGPEEMEFSRMFWGVARELLEAGRVRPIRIEVNRGGEGLEGVLEGMRELREGRVSGVKLVHTM